MKENKIKILIIIPHMNNGGAQRVVLNQLEVLSNISKFDVRLLVCNIKSNSYCNKIIKQKKYNVNYLKLYQKILFRFFEKQYPKFYLKKYLKKYNPDILHIHMGELLKYFSSPIFNENLCVKMVTFHNNPMGLPDKYINIINNVLIQYDFIPIFLNEQQVLLGKKCLKFNNYELLHNGINFKNIDKNIISKDEARKKFGLDTSDYIIGTAGRLEKTKNHKLLINSFAEVCKKKKNCKLVIAGDGSLLDELKTQTEKLEITSKVIFLGNIDDIIPFYCSLDVFAITSFSEASPLVLLESQRCGNYCVISDGVPSESVVTNNVVKMKKNATEKEWAEALLKKEIKTMKKILDYKDYDIDYCAKKNIDLYLKYYNKK